MVSPSPRTTVSAQPGPQTEFLQTAADICIYGGAAGGGKRVGLIPGPLRPVGRVANFTAVFFRRTTPQITNPGGHPAPARARTALATRRQGYGTRAKTS